MLFVDLLWIFVDNLKKEMILRSARREKQKNWKSISPGLPMFDRFFLLAWLLEKFDCGASEFCLNSDKKSENREGM